MNLPDAQESFRCIPESRKAVVLAWIMHDLTVAARDTYEVGTEQVADPARLRRFNELQHRLAAQVAKYASGTLERIQDDTVVAMIFGFEESSRKAFSRVIERETD